MPSWRAQWQLLLNFTFKAHLFALSLPVYSLLAKRLTLPSVSFEYEADARLAARCSQTFPWHSMNVHPLVPLGVDIHLTESNVRPHTVHLTLREMSSCRSCNFRFSAQLLLLLLLLVVLSFILLCCYFCRTGHVHESGSELVPMAGHVMASSNIS